MIERSKFHYVPQIDPCYQLPIKTTITGTSQSNPISQICAGYNGTCYDNSACPRNGYKLRIIDTKPINIVTIRECRPLSKRKTWEVIDAGAA